MEVTRPSIINSHCQPRSPQDRPCREAQQPEAPDDLCHKTLSLRHTTCVL